MSKVLAIAPHPDDETLGCGGTLLKHRANGDQIFWLIATRISEELGYTASRVEERSYEIESVKNAYGFEQIKCLDFLTTRLDTYPRDELVKAFSDFVREVEPETIYLPFHGDIHSEHNTVFETGIACTKWFRYPSVKRILAYETLSETDFAAKPDNCRFNPNVYVDISQEIDRKLSVMEIYASELGDPPFPRSAENIKALATIRGSASGFRYAESFMLIKERIS